MQTLLTLQTAGAVVVRTADSAVKVRPTPRTYLILGLGLGLVLGLGLALLRDALDTKLRTANDIGEILEMPILAVFRRRRGASSASAARHAGRPDFPGRRRVQTAPHERRVRRDRQAVSVVMVASAVAVEGKSTTFANLAVAIALAGKSVALADLDLHRPTLAKFFRLEDLDQPGLSGVVLGHATIDEALVPVGIEGAQSEDRNVSENGSTEVVGGARYPAGSLAVLPTGILPPDPGKFVGLEGVRHVVGGLRDRFDVVLINAPPLLAVGDGLTIAGFWMQSSLSFVAISRDGV